MANDPKNDKDDDDEDNVIRLAKARALMGERRPQNPHPEDFPIKSTKDVIDWMNRYYWKITLPGKVKFLSKRNPDKITFLDRKGLIEDTENLRLQITSVETGKQTIMPWSKVWLESRQRNELDDVIFHPDPKYVPRPRILNLWENYKLIPKDGDVSPYLGLMKNVICSDHERNYLYLVALIAQMFQFPHLKPGIAVVIRGEEGVGKSWFVERLCDLMAPYFFKTSNPKNIFGDHNGQLKHVILCHLEEAVWAGSKKDESLLKDLITGRSIEINEKYVPVMSVANHLHLFITGNPDWLVSAGFKARRLFALHASELRITDVKYFRDMEEWFFKAGGSEALLHYFLNFDIKAALDELGIDDLRKVPVTDELIHQKKQGMSGVAAWLDNLIEQREMPYGEPIGEVEEDYEHQGVKGTKQKRIHVRVVKKALYIDYLKSQEQLRSKVILNEKQFGIKFLDLLPSVVNGFVQKRANGKVKSVVDPNVKATDNFKMQRDGYDIPPWPVVCRAFDFTFGKHDSDVDESIEWTINNPFYPEMREWKR